MNDNKHNRQMTCHIKFDINNKKNRCQVENHLQIGLKITLQRDWYFHATHVCNLILNSKKKYLRVQYRSTLVDLERC